MRAWGGVELMQAYFAGLDTAAIAALTDEKRLLALDGLTAGARGAVSWCAEILAKYGPKA